MINLERLKASVTEFNMPWCTCLFIPVIQCEQNDRTIVSKLILQVWLRFKARFNWKSLNESSETLPTLLQLGCEKEVSISTFM